MKRFLKGILIGLLPAAGLVSSCNKTAEETPLENISLDIVFDKTDSLGINAQQFLYNIYTSLPQGYNRIAAGDGSGNDVLDAGTDDAVPSAINHQVEYFSTGKILPYTLPDNAWNTSYAAIREANIFLAHIDVVPLNLAGQKDQWKAEARFLRAMAYFELIKRWGGVPLIGDTVLGISDKINFSRNTYDDCVNYITVQLDSAAKYLPASYSSQFYGRITRGAAMALKAKTLLYAASPLNNPTADAGRWQLAADAAQAVIATGTYSLHSSFYSFFVTRQTNEAILCYMAAPGKVPETNNGPVGSVRGDLGLTSPTQELVDAFEMANGKAITESGSGYNADKPYTGRDPRLAWTVFYNGQSWLGRTVQTYDGGLDRPFGYGNATSKQTRTGYYMSKMLTTAGSNTSYTNAEHNFPVIRYAEVLLDFAEAQNEAAGPSTAVYNAIELIRKRAGLVPYALPAGLTKEAMREKIHHERRVELAFEEQRFWDIRRWKIAEEVLNGTLHGVQITNNSGTLTYKKVDVLKVSFDAANMYLYPIPYAEVVANTHMRQNPNW